MYSRIRRRFTYANVAMTLALVFAMTGGAFAAGKFLITSTKQIKPSVLAQLKGKAGPAGPEGKAGLGGPAGPAGPQGPAGKDGTNGQAGANGKDGANGESAKVEAAAASECSKEGGVKVSNASGSGTACNGKTGYTETLPSGKSERGVWTLGETDHVQLSGQVAKEEEVELKIGEAFAPISFTIPLAVPLSEDHVFFVTKEEEEKLNGKSVPAECGGTAEEPEAKKGNLCVYGFMERQGTQLEPEFDNPEKIGTALGAGLSGTVMVVSHPQERAKGYGTWVVTAP